MSTPHQTTHSRASTAPPQRREAETLPIQGTSDPSERRAFESFGFVFGPKASKLFVSVQFPQGWSRKATAHPTWTDLIDNQGRNRGSIYYKTRFYDRQASVVMNFRFRCRTQPEEWWDSPSKHRGGRQVGVVLDCDKIIFQTAPTEPEPTYPEIRADVWIAWRQTLHAKFVEAEAWLNQRYPRWREVAAYWEEEKL